jgi:hypothetical protein
MPMTERWIHILERAVAMKKVSCQSGIILLIIVLMDLGWITPSVHGELSHPRNAATVVAGGTILQDQTWSGDIIITNNVTVISGVTLTIAPGTIIRFEPRRPFFIYDAGLAVNGRLIANGTAGKPIRFTSNAIQPEPGDWGGIAFNRGSAGSILDHVIIEFSETAAYLNDNVTISNSIIRWVMQTALPVYGDATVTRNRIYQIGANAFEVHFRTKPVINYNTISGASYAGLQVIEGSHPTIAHNIIRDNDRGIDMGMLASPDIQYNLITGNSTGLNISDALDAASSILQRNNIQDNARNVSMQASQTLDMTRNWWGTADAAAIAALMSIGSAGKIVYQPYENQPVEIGSIAYDWNNTETYDFRSIDLDQYFYFESDSTRAITDLIRHDPKTGGSAGIAWDGQNLWSIMGGNYIHKLDATGKSLGSFPSPAVEAMGLAFDGQNLWLADYNQGLIMEVDRAGKALRSFPAPCQEPQGLAFDGQYLWTLTNQIHGKAFQFDRSGKLIRTLDTPGYLGIAWDGKYLWVDGGPDHFAQIDPANGHIVRLITSSGGHSDFLTWQGDSLWSIEYGILGFDQGSHAYLVKMLPSKETITLDGLLDDWQGRNPLVQDPQGDNVGTATDIKSLYGFMDNGNLYLMLDFHQFSGYDYAHVEFDINGDGKADYSLGGFFPGSPRSVVLHDYSTGLDRWINANGVDVRGTEMHSNAKEVAEFRIPRLVIGNQSSVGVRCSLAKMSADMIDQTGWAQIEGPRTALDLQMNPGGAANSSTAASKGTTQTGYAKIADNAGPIPYGTAVFSFKQNSVVVTEASVPASPPTTSARLFIDYRTSVAAVPGRSDAGRIDINTGIAVVNYGSATANVTYTLRDVNGVPLAVGHGTLAPGNHIACFIDQLKEAAAPDFNLPPNFQNATQFGTLDVAADQPMSVLALRGTNNQRREFLITATPIADLKQPPANGPLYFPHFADGGGYTTSLILLSASDSIESGTLQILNDDGGPLVVNSADGIPGSSFRYSIRPGGAFRFQTDGVQAGVKTGWVGLTPDPLTSTPIGSGVFGYNPAGILVTESAIPAAGSTTHARVYVDLSGGHNTGLAIANTTTTSGDIKIRAFQSDGVTGVGSSDGNLQLAGNGHKAKFADEFIAGLPLGFTGVLDISSTTPFTALTLRSLVNERRDFLLTAFPIADANRDAPSPLVFPQIADGGGYTTEFILLNSGKSFWPSHVTLEFRSETGAPLAVGK